MNWTSLFRRKPASPGIEHVRTRGSDAFADAIQLELRAAVSSAMARALEEQESRYLRSILQDSHFTLDALTIQVLDPATVRELDDLLLRHEAIAPGFRQRFFGLVVQREYRSTHGASVRVPHGFTPLIEMDPGCVDGTTQDEKYRISLRGQKIRFEARVTLGPPVRSKAQPLATLPPGHGPAVEPMGSGSAAPATNPVSPGAHVEIRIHDKHGTRSAKPVLPVILGRAPARREASAPAEANRLDVAGTYVSRRQLVVFELLGDICFLVPAGASLTCTLNGTTVLAMDQLYRLTGDVPAVLTAGVPMDGVLDHMPSHERADYPQFEIRRIADVENDEGTPVPRAVR